MTESNRIALECQKHLRVHLGMLNWAGQLADNIGKLQGAHFERILPLALTNHHFQSPEDRQSYEEHVRKRFRACAGLDFAKIEKELRTIDADIQKDIGTGSVGISPYFYNMVERRLAHVANRQHETDEKIQKLSNATQALHNYVASGNIDNDASYLVVHSMDVAYHYHKEISSHMQNIRLFNKIKDVNTNIVFVGANGSGKSTLALEMREALGITSSIIMAQPPISYGYRNFNRFDPQFSKQAIWGRLRSYAHGSIAELDELVGCLLTDFIDNTIDQRRDGVRAGGDAQLFLLESVCDLWGKIIPDRKLDYHKETRNLRAFNLKRKADYTITGLSDGERTVLYYAAFVMFAAQNEYIVVDEPENNLNLAVVNRLWDELEKLRPDCQFIYLTHNPDFAMGRRNARTLWIKNVIPNSGEWNYEELPVADEFNERLMIELVGERRKVLFCEGEPEGADCSVYKILLPGYSVKAVGSSRKVIDCVRAYKSTGIFSYSAAGVIDRDFRTDDKVQELSDDSIYCLKLPAVENLLCDEELLKMVGGRIAKPDVFSQACNLLLDRLEEHKGRLAAYYAHNFAERELRDKTPKKKNSLDCVIKEWRNLKLPSDDDIRRAYDEGLKKIENAIASKKYDECLAQYHCKSVIRIGNDVIPDYKDMVLRLLPDFLQENPDLRKILIDKYIPGLSAD